MAADRGVEYLDLDDLLDLTALLFGDRPVIRDVGLLGAAAARPATSVGGRDAYPDLWSMAAALVQGIVKNHALVDGNKRLGWLASAVFLDINGIEITTASNDDVYQLVMEVAAGNDSVEEIAAGLEALVGR